MPRRIKTRNLLLRPALAADLTALRDLLGEAPDEMAAPGVAGEIAPAALEQLVQSAGLDERRRLLVFEEEASDEVVGLLLAQLGKPWPRAAFVELMLLAPRVRGRGYGREAFEAWEERVVRREGVLEIQAAVRLGDGPAVAFWAALGYRDTGEVRRDDSGRRFRILARRCG